MDGAWRSMLQALKVSVEPSNRNCVRDMDVGTPIYHPARLIRLLCTCKNPRIQSGFACLTADWL